MNSDVIFLHAPSIYDFRNRVSFLGPISDVVPSTQVFDMYPLGFVSLSEYLSRNGYSTRIVNLAVKMLNNGDFDAEKFIRNIDPEVFCIDLHWLVHTQGSLEIARICKKYHPNTPVIFGGFTSTYFDKEILSKFEQVDFIIKGDSGELPLLRLLNILNKNKDNKKFEDIENLTWRDKNNRVKSNPITYVPESMDEFLHDPEFIIKSIIQSRDFEGHLPYKNWINIPIMAVLTSKGCLHNCITCGGSAYTYKNFYCRKKPAFMSPEKIIDYLSVIESYIKCPCFFINDIRMGGNKYWRGIFEGIERERIDLPVVFELFYPGERKFLEMMSHSCSRFDLEISPEDSSEIIRKSHGKSYSNISMEKTIKSALELGCDKFDVFFMIGLGKQRREDVYKTLRYMEHILNINPEKICPFISPYAPTIDPGSLAFEKPDKYGFIIKTRMISEQYELFQKPSWKYFFNYETEELRVDDIIDLTYESAIRLYEIKEKYNIIDSKTVSLRREQIEISRYVLNEIDEIITIKDENEMESKLNSLRDKISKVSESLLCSDNDLNWPRSDTKIRNVLLKVFGKLPKLL